jgi:hypothetical protein
LITVVFRWAVNIFSSCFQNSFVLVSWPHSP